jgi:cytochrome P450
MGVHASPEKRIFPGFAGTTLNPSGGPSVAEMLWLTSYQDVDEVFRSKDFEDGSNHRDPVPFTGHGLSSLSGADHFDRRRIESVLFRKPMLRYLEREVLAPALADRLSAFAAKRDIDGFVRTELQSLLAPALCKVSAALMGIDGVEAPEVIERYLHYTTKLGAGVSVEYATRHHHGVIRESLEFKTLFVREFFAPSWHRREKLVASFKAGEIAEHELPSDLLTVMIRHRDHFAQWDQDVFVRETILFNGAAIRTITLAAPHVIRELEEWLTQHPEDRQKVEDPEFLRRAISEALRLTQGGPWLLRRAIRDTTLASGRHFRQGEWVALDRVGASRDAAFGANPDRFDLHRTSTASRPFGFAFGGGPHTCIGMSLTIGEPSIANDPDAPLGMLVFILRELYRAGVELDPAKPPPWTEASVRHEYAEFPVRFRPT